MSTLQKIVGFIGLFFSTFAFSGMFLWLFGRRGKGGGTMGSAVIGVLLLILYQYHLQFYHLLGAIFISLIVGIPAVYAGEKFMLEKWGPAKRHTGEIVTKDFNETCIDEVHGMLIAVLPIYLARSIYSFNFPEFFFLHLVAFGAFRLFDAKKIGPIKTIEETKRIPVSTSIMFDDSMAGIFATIVVLVPTLIIAQII